METNQYESSSIELSDKVYISDPCYGLNTWCQKLLENVKPGEYLTFIEKSDEGTWGKRVSNIWVLHEDYQDTYPYCQVEDACIGVDAGMAGIFDAEYYKKYHKDQKDEYPHADETWYDNVCESINDYDIDGNEIDYSYLSDYHYNEETYEFEYAKPSFNERRNFCTLDNKCLISSSGYGDGSYPLYVSKNSEGEIVGIRIEFIGDEEGDEDKYLTEARDIASNR